MRNRKHTTWAGRLALVAALAALTACGGGGDDSSTDTPTDGTTTPAPGTPTDLREITLSQSTADAAVATVNEGVAAVREVGAANLLPGGLVARGLPTGATSSGTIQCSTLGSSGSGSIDYTMTYDDSTFFPSSYSYVYNNCTFSSTGYSYAMSGSGSLNYSRYVSATDYVFTLVYDLTYSYTGGGYSDSGTVSSTETCTASGDSVDCTYQVGDSALRDVSITTSGSVTTIDNATIDGSYVDCVYSGWSYDASNGRATSGTVTVTDGNGNTAVITATTSGYTVVITVGGSSQTYTVSFG